jgi:hypothetical protein
MNHGDRADSAAREITELEYTIRNTAGLLKAVTGYAAVIALNRMRVFVFIPYSYTVINATLSDETTPPLSENISSSPFR